MFKSWKRSILKFFHFNAAKMAKSSFKSKLFDSSFQTSILGATFITVSVYFSSTAEIPYSYCLSFK